MPTNLPTSSARQILCASCVAAFAIFWLALLPTETSAQGVDTVRTITLPAPENGVIYIRSGRPGGVRIRSRHMTRRGSENSQMPMAGQQGLLGSPATFRTADLTRLEALLARQGLDLDLSLARRGGEDVVVLRRRTDASAADTLSLTAATDLLVSLGGRARPDEAARADVPPLATRVERSMLEAGFFRSLQVNFEFDRSELLPTSAPALDAVADVLERFPDLRIEVAGHADSVGPDAYNRRLSEERAEQVRRSLIGRGVGLDRVRAQGYGEARPVLSNDTPTGRALNRRVEFVVLNPDAAAQYRGRTPQYPEQQLERLRRSIREGIRDGFEETTEEND